MTQESKKSRRERLAVLKDMMENDPDVLMEHMFNLYKLAQEGMRYDQLANKFNQCIKGTPDWLKPVEGVDKVEWDEHLTELKNLDARAIDWRASRDWVALNSETKFGHQLRTLKALRLLKEIP